MSATPPCHPTEHDALAAVDALEASGDLLGALDALVRIAASPRSATLERHLVRLRRAAFARLPRGSVPWPRAGLEWLSNEGRRIGPDGSVLLLGLNTQVGVDWRGQRWPSPFRPLEMDGVRIRQMRSMIADVRAKGEPVKESAKEEGAST